MYLILKSLVIIFDTKKIFLFKMYSSESEQSDNVTKRINFNEFLYARHHQYKWKDLEYGKKKNLHCTNSIV